MFIVTIATCCLAFVHEFDHGRRPLEIRCPSITSTTEVPRTVVQPKHVYLDRCTRTSRSALVGRNVGGYPTEVWCPVVRFQRQRTLASWLALTDILFRCYDVTEGGRFAPRLMVREPVGWWQRCMRWNSPFVTRLSRWLPDSTVPRTNH